MYVCMYVCVVGVCICVGVRACVCAHLSMFFLSYGICVEVLRCDEPLFNKNRLTTWVRFGNCL